MLKLRPAKSSDLKEMQTLFIDTISAVCTTDYNSQQINVWKSSAKNAQRWLDAIKEQFFIVAEKDNKIVGYGSLENKTYLDFLYVHKDYQRQNIAQTIYSVLQDQARKSGIKILTSDVSKTAKPFFERNGFKLVSEKTNLILGIEIINYRMTKELN